MDAKPTFARCMFVAWMYRCLFNDSLSLEMLLMFEKCDGMFLIRKFKGLGKE